MSGSLLLLEVMHSRSGLFRESGLFRLHVLKVRVAYMGWSCLQGHSCFRHHVYKDRFALRSCLEFQDCLEITSSRPGLLRGHVFKVTVVRGLVFKVRIV